MEHISVTHAPEKHLFEVSLESSTAFLRYILSEDRMNITTTYVPPAIEGRGVAAALAREALEYARANRLKVIPSCGYIDIYIRRHPQYADLL